MPQKYMNHLVHFVKKKYSHVNYKTIYKHKHTFSLGHRLKRPKICSFLGTDSTQTFWACHKKPRLKKEPIGSYLENDHRNATHKGVHLLNGENEKKIR